MRRPPIALLATATILGFGCGKAEAPAEPKPAEAGEERAAKEAPSGSVELTAAATKDSGIVVRTVQSAPFQAQLTVPGVVGRTPSGRATVTPPVSGRVVRLLATVGDVVRLGQPLAVVESVDLAERATAVTEARRGLLSVQADVSRTESELTLAKGRRRTADEALRRQRALARAGAFSQPSLQVAQRELNDAQSALESSQKEAVVHRTQLERSERLYKQELVSRIDLENARLDVEKDRIAQERATREIEIARASFERERQIGSKGLLNAREIQAAEADVRAASLEVAKAEIALRSARAALAGARLAIANAQSAYAALRGSGNLAEGGRLTVVAPMGGSVVHREVGVGQAVERTAELFEIDDLRAVYVTAQVPERQIVGVRVGARVTVSTDAYPRRSFSGTVATLGGRLEPKTRTLPVQCLVPNADGALRPEMFAQVGLGTGAGGVALAVPISAVFEAEGKSYVFVETAAGKYARRAVALGRTGGIRQEIVKGLEPGARVVVEGVFTLRSQSQKDELKGEE